MLPCRRHVDGLRCHRALFEQHHGPSLRTRPGPFNSTPMAANPLSSGSPHVHVRPMGMHRTCGEPDEIKKNTQPVYITALFLRAQAYGSITARRDDSRIFALCTRPEPFNSTPMAVNPISPGSPHVLRAHMGVHRTCGEPDEIKKNTHPKIFYRSFFSCRDSEHGRGAEPPRAGRGCPVASAPPSLCVQPPASKNAAYAHFRGHACPCGHGINQLLRCTIATFFIAAARRRKPRSGRTCWASSCGGTRRTRGRRGGTGTTSSPSR